MTALNDLNDCARRERRDFLKTLSHGALLAVVPPALPGAAGAAAATPQNGDWVVTLDREDRGIADGWFRRPLARPQTVPETLPSSGLGDPVTATTEWTARLGQRVIDNVPEYAAYRQPGNIKVPYFLQPDTHYVGAAWYQREIVIPADWAGRRAVVSLERPHWETRVWIDGRYVGRNDSLYTAHEYDLGKLAPGRHRLTVRVDNRMVVDIGTGSHGVTDHTQGNWNGIVGKIELYARRDTWLDDLQAWPDVASRRVTIKGVIGNASGLAGKGTVHLDSGGARQRIPVAWRAGGGKFEAVLQYPADAPLWDEFTPVLHDATARLDDGPSEMVRFGFRQIARSGTEFRLNGRPLFLRGTLECCIFPLTGHPPTAIEEWQRILRVARAYGLNHLRFHSWCPPQAAFEAADQAGFYLQVELGWVNGSSSIGDGKPVDAWSMAETVRILKAYGNHASFMFMAHGNEPGGDNHKRWLGGYVKHFAALDQRRLWASGAGWPEIPESDYHILLKPRIQQWDDELKSRVNARAGETTTDYREIIGAAKVPMVSHEIGQWCAYPDLDERKQYTGYLKAKNFDIFEDRLVASGLRALAPAFLHASGRLQTLLYKEDIESALRTPGMGGFQLLDLHDFPGQGTATVGVLNPFWREKGYVSAAEYSRFCGPTVVLARLARRVFDTSERLHAQLEVAHGGAVPLGASTVYWRLETGDQVLAQGEFPVTGVAQGNAIALGSIDAGLAGVQKAAKCRLVAGLRSAQLPVTVENDWEVWVYPAAPAVAPAGSSEVTIVDSIAAALPLLEQGATVLVGLPPRAVRNYDDQPVKFGFTTIFWNSLWNGRQAPTTLGILCNPAHPALADFPTDAHTNWQWWHIVHRAQPLRLDQLPPAVDPIVRVIDDWYTARPLGLVVEARVGRGRVIVCGFELGDGAGGDVVSRQLRRSLSAYAASRRFAPTVEVSAAQLAALTV